MLFNNYDKIVYKFENREVTVSDIFKHISFRSTDSNAFQDYYIQDGESPDVVSLKVYGNSNFSWLIMLANNLQRIKGDWYESQEEYLRNRERDYGGDAIYIPSLPPIEPGDVIVKATTVSGNETTAVDTSVYRNIVSFDRNLRKIRGISGAGVFTDGDLAVIARYNPENGEVAPLQFTGTGADEETVDYTQIIHTEPYIESVDYFYTPNDVVVDPLKTGTSISSPTIKFGTTYTDPSDLLTTNNYANTLIYKYGASGGVPVAGLFSSTINTKVFDDYRDKQKIKILKREYLGKVISLIETALDSNEIGKTFRIVI